MGLIVCSAGIKNQEGYDIAKKKIDRLENLGVLRGIQCIADAVLLSKKSGGVRFVTDFRKLNLQTQRHPSPLPDVKEALRKMEGFTHATCLDANMGCCHALLDKDSQETCSIILPWGKHCYTRLPQGLNYSPDAFQEKMDSIFSDDENVFCCIDNILLVAHDGFEDHLNQIDEVSSRLTNNNVQTHIEETFLAASSFDYLGCRLTHHGIKIQEKMNEGYFKHCATRCSLRITPTHRLCSMLPRHASPKK